MAICTFYIRVLLENMPHVTQVRSAGQGYSGQERMSPGQAENIRGEQRELQQDSSDESTCYKNGLGLAGTCGFDLSSARRLVGAGKI